MSALIAGLVLATDAPAAASEAPAPALTPAQAGEELAEAVDALTAPPGPGEGADATTELRDLLLALPSLEGAERRRAKAILARPPADDGSFDQGAEWSGPATATAKACDSTGGQFRVHYVTISDDAPPPGDTGDPVCADTPDYVEDVADFADESYSTQNTALAWPDPVSDGSRGGDDRTDIYLSDLPAGLFGYAAPEGPAQGCDQPPFRCFAYLVVDNDYSEPQYGYGGVPEIPLQVTVAHEYNHVLQFALDAWQDVWMFESTATWAEEKTFPDADDWIQTFMGFWARTPQIPIAMDRAPRHYGTAVWNHWLELGAGYGADAVLKAWRLSRKSSPRHFAPGAYNRTIKRSGGRGFAREFGRFAAATAEWQARGDAFPNAAQLRDVRRQGSLRPGGGARRFELDHTAYRLLHLRRQGKGRLQLRVRAPRGVRTMIALIGRDGGPTTGAVIAKHGYLNRGGRGSVQIRRAGRFERLTALVANAHARPRGFDGFDWRFRHDNSRYAARLR